LPRLILLLLRLLRGSLLRLLLSAFGLLLAGLLPS
jgi:hypothetical protein